MDMIFYISSAIAIISTIMVITRLNAVHALLYLVLSLLSVAVVFFTMGAPFIAALEIIVYAGAIMVLFIFVVMMLNLGGEAVKFERQITKPSVWIIPLLLSAVLMVEVVFLIYSGDSISFPEKWVGPKAVGEALFSKYIIAVELAAIMLLAGVVGAYHLGRRKPRIVHRYLKEKEEGS